jgi:hypothetical protein
MAQTHTKSIKHNVIVFYIAYASASAILSLMLCYTNALAYTLAPP